MDPVINEELKSQFRNQMAAHRVIKHKYSVCSRSKTEQQLKATRMKEHTWWMWRRGAIGLVPACREKAIVVGRFCFDLHGATAPLLFFALLLGRQRTRLVAATDTAHTSK
jgi:hypothetical protein